MKILWLNAGLLLPLDKGGKLRTWHLMRHLAARHDITYLSFSDPSQTEARPRRHARGLLAAARRFPAPTRPRARCASTSTPPATSSIRCRTRWRSTARPPIAHALRGAAATGALRRRRLRLPAAGRQPAASGCPAPPSSSRTTSRRRSGGGTPRTATNPGRAAPARRSSGAACCASSATALARFDLVLAVSEADGETFERLYPGALRAPVHVVQTGVDTAVLQSPQSADAGAARAPRLHRLDGLAAERRRHALLRAATSCRASARRNPGRRSASSAARRRRPSAGSPTSTASRSPAASTTSGRTSRAGSVYVVPLRIGGGTRLKIFEAMAHGQGRRLDHHRRRRPAGDRRRDIVIADEPAAFAAGRRPA